MVPAGYTGFPQQAWERVWEMGKLSAAQVKSLTGRGRYSDGDGLYLNIAKGGSKSWVLRITIDRRRRDLGLGSIKGVSLAEARIRAHDLRVAVAQERDPIAEKRRGDIPSFSDAAKTVHEAHRPLWRNAKHADEWIRSLEKHAMPTIGAMPVDRIQQTDVLAVLKPIWSTKPETARRVRQRIKLVLGYCQAHGHIEHNAAGEAIDGALPSMRRTQQHFRSLPYVKVSDALKVVDASGSAPASKLCLRFVILTAARPGEARGARWSEIDMGGREWRLPPERMKAGIAHRVPLSDAALEVLDAAKALRDDSDFVFPSPRKQGHPLSNVTLTKVLRDCGLAKQATVHGFRSSFRTWALECTGAQWAVAEAALAHRLGNSTEQAYVRDADPFRHRQELMQEWADYLAGG